jgi:hypothetical protein
MRNRWTKAPLREVVLKRGLCGFDRIVIELSMEISSDERNISANFHDYQYTPRPVKPPQKRFKLVYFQVFTFLKP